MQLYTNSVQDRFGNALKGAQITVRTAAGVLATLYADNGVTLATNPLTADATGEFRFYAANGRYTFTVTASGMQAEIVSAFEMQDALELQAAVTVGAAQVAADRIATGQDKAATAADRLATAADRVITTQDKGATAADRLVTAEDRAVTTADRTATGLDKADALATRTAIDHRYRGALAADPATRTDGSANVVGDEYFNTVASRKMVFRATGWLDFELNASNSAAASEASRQVSVTQAGIATTQAGLATTNGAAQVTLAANQVTLAATAKTAAEAARDAALIQSGVYTTEALGRAAVADGVAFKVQGGGDVAAYEYRRTNSTTSTLIASYPASSAIINNNTLAAADNYATPPTLTAQTLGTATPTSPGGVNYLHKAVLWNDPANASTLSGIVRVFSVRLANADAARKVEFYITNAEQTVLWASGLIAATAAGVFTYSVAIAQNARIPVGGFLGVYIDAVQANSMQVGQSGGPALYTALWSPTSGQLSVGAIIATGSGGFTAQTNYLPALSADIVHEAIFVATRWANQPNGYPKLSAAAKLAPSTLPDYLADMSVRSSTAGVVTSEFDASLAATKTISRADTAISTLSVVSSVAGGGATYPENQIIIGWLNGSPGFLKSGLLTKLRFPSGGTRQSNAKIQAWVVRPTTAPGASGTTLAFTLVAKIGEIVATDSTKHAEFANLSIPVLAGDMIAFRGINAGMRYGDGSAEFTNHYWIPATLGDASLAALDSGVSATVNVGRKHDLYAEVSPATFAIPGAGPNVGLRLDGLGNIPADAVRAYDAPWKGLSIGAVGTSITAGGNATGLNGYIRQTGVMLQCVMDNQGVGSSGIVWNGTRAISLSATRAQLTTAGFDPSQSYETKMLGKNKDLWIFDHGYNDRDYTIGTIDSTDKATFYGAYNTIIQSLLAEKPTQQFMFITPHSVYSPTNEGYHATTDAIRTAILELGVKYCAPVLDFTRTLQLNAYQAVSMLPDTVHPSDLLHTRASRQLYQFVKGL